MRPSSIAAFRASLVLALLLAGLSRQSVARSQAPNRLVDSSGKTVGAIVGSLGGGILFVLRKVNQYAVEFLVERDGILNTGDGGFMHDTTDCSGPRFLSVVDEKVLVRDVTRIDFSSTGAGPFEYHFAGDPIQSHKVKSFEWSAAPDDCKPPFATRLANGLCCFPANTILIGGPANVAIDPSKLHPPFSIR